MDMDMDMDMDMVYICWSIYSVGGEKIYTCSALSLASLGKAHTGDN